MSGANRYDDISHFRTTSMPIRRENMKTSKRRKKEKGSDPSRCHGGNVLVNNFYFYVRKRIRSTTHIRIYGKLEEGKKCHELLSDVVVRKLILRSWMGDGKFIEIFSWMTSHSITHNSQIIRSIVVLSVKAGNNYIHIIMCVIYFTILHMQIEMLKIEPFWYNLWLRHYLGMKWL